MLEKRGAARGWAGDLEAWQAALRAAGRPPTTCELRRYHVRRLSWELGAASPWEVTADALVSWMGSRDWSADTRRSWRSSARGFWGWGVATERTGSNPAAALAPVRPAPPCPHPAPEVAYRVALARADPREVLMVRLAAELGLRRAEVAQVHGRDVVDDVGGGRSLRVHGKGGRTRLVPMPPGLARVVLDGAAAGYLFPGQVDGHLSPAWVGRVVSRLLPEGVTMHALRHRFATLAYRVDHDLFTVQGLLGHVSPETTARYVLRDDTAARRLVLLVAG